MWKYLDVAIAVFVGRVIEEIKTVFREKSTLVLYYAPRALIQNDQNLFSSHESQLGRIAYCLCHRS